MDKEDFNHSKITKIEPYQNADGRWLFNLTYELWDDDGNVAELNVPCVESQFLSCAGTIHLYEQSDEQKAYDKYGNVICKYDEMYYKANIETLENIDIYGVNNYFFTIKIIKKKMTIDDIEKVLGYKVEIIDKDKKED